MIHREPNASVGQPESRAELVERLSSVPATIIRLVSDRTADDLRQPGQDAGVGVVEILCDLQDWEEITGARVARILYEDTPKLESYDDSLWSIEHDYAARNSDDVIEAFIRLRANLVETLSRLDDESWQRTAQLADHGQVTIAWLMEQVVAHDEQHIAEIMEALA
jgi:hypothetical protein